MRDYKLYSIVISFLIAPVSIANQHIDFFAIEQSDIPSDISTEIPPELHNLQHLNQIQRKSALPSYSKSYPHLYQFSKKEDLTLGRHKTFYGNKETLSIFVPPEPLEDPQVAMDTIRRI